MEICKVAGCPFALTLVICGIPISAATEPLGDRIAEYLCFPASAEYLKLSAAELAQLQSSPRIRGRYRDIQGSEARAWFEAGDGRAHCRTPATRQLDLFFCAEVRIADGYLRRSARSLCP